MDHVMAPPNMSSGDPIVDPSDVRFRVRTITTGIVLCVAQYLASIGYFLLTPEGAHRELLVTLAGLALAATLLLILLPTEEIVRGRLCEPFFLVWSAAQLGLVTIFVALDGGPGSPLALTYFLTLIFAGVSFPPRTALFVGLLALLSYGVVGFSSQETEREYMAFFVSTLGCTAFMCAWLARHHTQQREELARVSRADPLTGCLNRRGFEERLGAELTHATRTARPLALLLLDLDDFKLVNDTHGHSVGDDLLCWTVETMRSVVRPSDAIGRLGGDEFAVILPEAGQADALATAARVREVLHARSPASMGVAAFPADGAGVEELVRRADAALYAQKHGRAVDLAPDRADLSWAAAMAEAVDARMAGHSHHSSSVAPYAVSIAAELGWQEPRIGQLRLAAMLHDLGKVALPDRILRKPAALTTDEISEMRDHSAIGADIVARIDGLGQVVPWIRHSHEHWDGSGYPDGLRADEIPAASRILLVADALDAMTSERPYRGAMTLDEALTELERNAGTQFEPRCVEAIVATLRDAPETASREDAAGESAAA
jgi:diguanylate cyclase (GGDEF)-like protein